MDLPAVEPTCGYCICGHCNLAEVRETIARQLWILDAGSDAAWPHAGAHRDRFYLLADDMIAAMVNEARSRR